MPLEMAQVIEMARIFGVDIKNEPYLVHVSGQNLICVSFFATLPW